MMEQYKGAGIGELRPHPFAIADSAYRVMINEGKSQSVLVSGESGAGKTETTKLLMRYLAYVGGRAASGGRSVEQKVLESNPVLEAFGNAKTVRNNNSSRFGKFVELQFDQKGRISGAAIRTYLLETCRVCQTSDPERNFHCFYMLCAGPQEDLTKYKLESPRTYRYLNQSSCFELEGVDDAKEYLDTRRAMDVVGMSSDEQDAIFRVVAAILHIGNIELAKGDEIDSSKPKDEKSWFHLKTAAELFMCDPKSLEDSLCKRVMVTRDETITKLLDPDSAAISRDALAKVVYSRLFDWLANKINISVGQDPESKNSIGVLDIYGFESFKVNSFEQFCINWTNEKLQQHFNQHVFKMEKEEYAKEQINWNCDEFVDNQDVLDLIEKKPGGIIALLDEACMFPRSTHETFAQKLYQTYKNHKRLNKPKLSRTDFTICHYAGDVTYQTDQFLDKNKDYVIAEHHSLLSASSCPFVAGLFPPLAEDSSKSSKFSSIGTRFKQQLQALLETLSSTEPHYIRCVEPNNLLKPAIFENRNVLQQLRCGGVMEAIRISCAGYPTKKQFHDFADRFGILAPEVLDGSFDEVVACEKILEKAGLVGYQIGKTKVFLRAGQMAVLDARRGEVLGRSASIIQREVRSYLHRRYFIMLCQSAERIQAACRGQLARKLFESKRRKASSMYLAREAYNNICASAISIQAGMRGMVTRNELCFRRQTGAAILIQSQCRKFMARSHYIDLKKAAIATQCAWRRKLARLELRNLKMAARETGALQAAKNKLEKQVEELTWRLQLEKRVRDNIMKIRKVYDAFMSKFASCFGYREKHADHEARLGSKIIGFESGIRRPYFHVRPLNVAELENWHNYLDFIENEGDLNKVVKLYERCLIVCANYPEYRIRYIKFMEANGRMEIANNALARATQVFAKRQPEIHLFAALFKEQLGDMSGARAAYQLVHSEISPGLLGAIIKHANMEKILGKLEDSYSLYEQAIAIEKGKGHSQILPMLLAQYSRFVYTVSGNVEMAREILVSALDHVYPSKPLLEALIYLESILSVPKQVNQLELLVGRYLNPNSDSPNDATACEEELSCIYLEVPSIGVKMILLSNCLHLSRGTKQTAVIPTLVAPALRAAVAIAPPPAD